MMVYSHLISKKTFPKVTRKKEIVGTIDDACHEPTSTGPCKAGDWIVAVNEHLQGVCRIIECTEDDNPIMFNGTCSSLY